MLSSLPDKLVRHLIFLKNQLAFALTYRPSWGSSFAQSWLQTQLGRRSITWKDPFRLELLSSTISFLQFFHFFSSFSLSHFSLHTFLQQEFLNFQNNAFSTKKYRTNTLVSQNVTGDCNDSEFIEAYCTGLILCSIYKGWFINFRNKSIFYQGKFKKKVTTQAGRLEFFTLITQVSSRSNHSDTRMGQACKDELILVTEGSAWRKNMAVTSATHESSDSTHRSMRLCTIQLCFKNSVDRLTLTTTRVT